MTIAFNSTTESGFIKADFDQISAYLSGADDSTTLEARLDGVDTTVSNLTTTVNNNKTLAEKDTGLLGEVKQFALSLTGAVTKATLQSKGWAICDGTTPAAQGIADATITTTPDLRERFLRHSADETTGGTGGSATHNHLWFEAGGSFVSGNYTLKSFNGNSGNYKTANSSGTLASIENFCDDDDFMDTSAYTTKTDTQPPYYDICYFIKVKV